MVTSPQVSWLFFKARAKRPYLSHTGRASNAEKQPTGRGPEGCVENGPAAALLVGYVSIEICALLPPCRRPILNATTSPLYARRYTRIAGAGRCAPARPALHMCVNLGAVQGLRPEGTKGLAQGFNQVSTLGTRQAKMHPESGARMKTRANASLVVMASANQMSYADFADDRNRESGVIRRKHASGTKMQSAETIFP